MSDWRPKGVHLVGSVPLPSRTEVFRQCAATLGDRLLRLPDGEVGPTKGWIRARFPALAAHPLLETGEANPRDLIPLPLVRLRAGADPSALSFSHLGNDDAVRDSWREFSDMQAAGAIPAHYRFQFSLPTPLGTITRLVDPAWQGTIEPPYEAAVLNEIREMAKAVPAGRLTVQWDVAIEMMIWEGVREAHFGDVRDGIVQRCARIGEAVPESVELGFHFCYGDAGHRHGIEPKDAANLVEIARRVSERVRRPIAYVHMPVPRDRKDGAYFAPLKNLKLHPETRLYLGLVHFTDGLAGTLERLAAAREVVGEFGVATECGLGRRDPATIPDLLRLHAEVAGPAL